MKISYDAAATDTLTVVLRDAPARISADEKSGVILDYDAEGRLIALEVPNAAPRVAAVDAVQLQVIPRPGARHPPRQNDPSDTQGVICATRGQKTQASCGS